MAKYILHAFPNEFLPLASQNLQLSGISEEEAKKWVDSSVISAIWNENFAELFSYRLGVDLKVNRIKVDFHPENEYLIGGLRLPGTPNEREISPRKNISLPFPKRLPIRWVLVQPLMPLAVLWKTSSTSIENDRNLALYSIVGK